ncbi:MAG: hypothetical protein WC819_02495 [Parcubacteria group bacterium]
MNEKEPFEPPVDPPMFRDNPYVTWEKELSELSTGDNDVKNTPQN